MGKNKKENDTFLRKENRTKTKQCYHDDTCRWNTDSFSSEVEITKGIVWIKIFKKIIKDLMNLIETNHLINMTYDHSIWSNNSIKSH